MVEAIHLGPAEAGELHAVDSASPWPARQVRAAVTRAPGGYDLDRIDDAFRDCEAGTTIKPIVRMS